MDPNSDVDQDECGSVCSYGYEYSVGEYSDYDNVVDNSY